MAHCQEISVLQRRFILATNLKTDAAGPFGTLPLQIG
jgi:hypothetical protein